jgi:hypothetical protein
LRHAHRVQPPQPRLAGGGRLDQPDGRHQGGPRTGLSPAEPPLGQGFLEGLLTVALVELEPDPGGGEVVLEDRRHLGPPPVQGRTLLGGDGLRDPVEPPHLQKTQQHEQRRAETGAHRHRPPSTFHRRRC